MGCLGIRTCINIYIQHTKFIALASPYHFKAHHSYQLLPFKQRNRTMMKTLVLYGLTLVFFFLSGMPYVVSSFNMLYIPQTKKKKISGVATITFLRIDHQSSGQQLCVLHIIGYSIALQGSKNFLKFFFFNNCFPFCVW